ncbi:hypothetical protein [Nostoc sp. UHCC 0252]|nr:hypothetical protein [Nostoc sp. UHCC 0252]MEA5600863.1 hypothetical protein [Nostoc sp. UHCC 0252]
MRSQLGEVQTILRAQQCCSPTCVFHLPKKRCSKAIAPIAPTDV